MRGLSFAILVVAAAAVGASAQAPHAFVFDPQPRWAEDPETEEVCKAIAAECSAKFPDGEIETSWGYAELYDADGYLVGLRTTTSTGCKPLDEHMLLSHRHFRTTFSEAGKPDLDDIVVELKAGTPKDSVRLVKRGETQLSLGC